MEDTTKTKAEKPSRRRKKGWGGKRENAGRKPSNNAENILSAQLTMRVRSNTYERVRKLRELTKGDTMPFNRMFEAWVEEMAKDYGLD